jgi:glycosyltransferase involved in cell wall biosynthesis
MANGTRFSVVCAAYNARDTVIHAVNSCLQQTYPPYEVIVVDDGSTDGTAELLEETFGNSVRLIRLEKNSGPSAARNQGMDAATGDFIALQDADDWWHPEKLGRVAKVLGEQQCARFVFHGYMHEQMPLKEVKPAQPYPFWKLMLRNVVATPCAIVINDVRLRFDERLRQMEDWDLFLQAAEKWCVVSRCAADSAWPACALARRLKLISPPDEGG